VTGSDSASSTPGRSGRTESEKPYMFSEVITAAGPMTSRVRSPSAVPSTARVRMSISIGLVLPVLFTSTASGVSSETPSADSRASSGSTSREAACCAPSTVTFCTPGSPWMPRPSSACASYERTGCPGRSQVARDSDIELTAAATSFALATTVSRSAPFAAWYPATLCTSTVPARPRGWSASGSAMSSETITIPTFSPRVLARSAASPKFSRSPV